LGIVKHLLIVNVLCLELALARSFCRIGPCPFILHGIGPCPFNHDVPETSILTESSDNDAEVENDKDIKERK